MNTKVTDLETVKLKVQLKQTKHRWRITVSPHKEAHTRTSNKRSTEEGGRGSQDTGQAGPGPGQRERQKKPFETEVVGARAESKEEEARVEPHPKSQDAGPRQSQGRGEPWWSLARQSQGDYGLRRSQRRRSWDQGGSGLAGQVGAGGSEDQGGAGVGVLGLTESSGAKEALKGQKAEVEPRARKPEVVPRDPHSRA